MTADSSAVTHRGPRRSQDSTNNSRFQLYYQMTKPGIVYSNVMTGASGYLLASKWHIHILKLLSLLLGMGLLIAGACVLNNYLDRGLDARMERTSKRAIPAGKVSLVQALGYGAALLVIGFLFLLNTNNLTLVLGALAVFFYVVVYGFFKRHSVYGTFVGTLPGAASLVAGYTSVTGKFTFGALLLLLLMVCWQMPHFYGIAIYRLKDYSSAGLPLWPIKRGIDSTVKQIRLYIEGFLVVCFLLTVFGYAGYSFLAVMVLVGGYWLNLAFKNVDSKNEEAWAKKVFLTSLMVLLTMSVMLPLSRVIP